MKLFNRKENTMATLDEVLAKANTLSEEEKKIVADKLSGAMGKDEKVENKEVKTEEVKTEEVKPNGEDKGEVKAEEVKTEEVGDNGNGENPIPNGEAQPNAEEGVVEEEQTPMEVGIKVSDLVTNEVLAEKLGALNAKLEALAQENAELKKFKGNFGTGMKQGMEGGKQSKYESFEEYSARFKK